MVAVTTTDRAPGRKRLDVGARRPPTRAGTASRRHGRARASRAAGASSGSAVAGAMPHSVEAERRARCCLDAGGGQHGVPEYALDTKLTKARLEGHDIQPSCLGSSCRERARALRATRAGAARTAGCRRGGRPSAPPACRCGTPPRTRSRGAVVGGRHHRRRRPRAVSAAPAPSSRNSSRPVRPSDAGRSRRRRTAAAARPC